MSSLIPKDFRFRSAWRAQAAQGTALCLPARCPPPGARTNSTQWYVPEGCWCHWGFRELHQRWSRPGVPCKPMGQHLLGLVPFVLLTPRDSWGAVLFTFLYR